MTLGFRQQKSPSRPFLRRLWYERGGVAQAGSPRRARSCADCRLLMYAGKAGVSWNGLGFCIQFFFGGEGRSVIVVVILGYCRGGATLKRRRIVLGLVMCLYICLPYKGPLFLGSRSKVGVSRRHLLRATPPCSGSAAMSPCFSPSFAPPTTPPSSLRSCTLSGLPGNDRSRRVFGLVECADLNKVYDGNATLVDCGRPS